MDIKSLIKNVTPEQLVKIEENLGKVIPFIEDKLPLLQKMEDVWRTEYNINKDDIFLYTAVKTPNNKKILIYIFTGFPAPEKHTFSNGRILEKGSVIISGEVKAMDLTEFLRGLTANGLTGLIENLM